MTQRAPDEWEITRLRLRLELALASSGGGSSSGEIVIAVPFQFDTPSPFLLTPELPANVLINRTAILISEAFDDGAATLDLGIPAAAALFLTNATDITPTIAGTYDSDELVNLVAATNVQLTISPGGSTQGGGFVLVKAKAL